MRYRKADDVYEKTVGETFFVFSARGGFYGFDGVGRDIWRLVVAGRTQDEIVREIAAEYDADAEAVCRDVAEFVHDVDGQRLVVPRSAGGEGP